MVLSLKKIFDALAKARDNSELQSIADNLNTKLKSEKSKLQVRMLKRAFENGTEQETFEKIRSRLQSLIEDIDADKETHDHEWFMWEMREQTSNGIRMANVSNRLDDNPVRLEGVEGDNPFHPRPKLDLD